MKFLMSKYTNMVMNDRRVHPLAKTLVNNCDEMLSWMAEIWMNNHLVSDSHFISIILQQNYKEWKYVGLTFSVHDTIP